MILNTDTFFKKITVADANTPYKSVDDVLMSEDGKTLIMAATGKSFENYSVPSGVTEITDSAFQEAKGLKGTLTIPKGVEKIGNSAFAGCNNLTGTLVIPDSVTQIGKFAFYRCTGFTSISYKSGTAIEQDAFEGCVTPTAI